MSNFKKDDAQKPRMELLDPEFLLGVAQVLTFGAIKYEPYNWQKASDEDIERIKGAMLRHQMAYMGGETIDPETGLNHMYHISCNAMFLAYFDRHKGEHRGQGSLMSDAKEPIIMDGFDPVGPQANMDINLPSYTTMASRLNLSLHDHNDNMIRYWHEGACLIDIRQDGIGVDKTREQLYAIIIDHYESSERGKTRDV